MLSDETRTRCVRRPHHTGKCRFEPKSRALRPSYAPEDRVGCLSGCALTHLHLAPCQDANGNAISPRDVRCPACDAEPGAPCWADTHKDRTIDDHHRDRILAVSNPAAEIAAAIKAGEHPADILRRVAYAAIDNATDQIRRTWDTYIGLEDLKKETD
jgi:hypothetical protein